MGMVWGGWTWGVAELFPSRNDPMIPQPRSQHTAGSQPISQLLPSIELCPPGQALGGAERAHLWGAYKGHSFTVRTL